MLPSTALVRNRGFQKLCQHFQHWQKGQDAELKVEEKDMERKARAEMHRTVKALSQRSSEDNEGNTTLPTESQGEGLLFLNACKWTPLHNCHAAWRLHPTLLVWENELKVSQICWLKTFHDFLTVRVRNTGTVQVNQCSHASAGHLYKCAYLPQERRNHTYIILLIKKRKIPYP